MKGRTYNYVSFKVRRNSLNLTFNLNTMSYLYIGVRAIFCQGGGGGGKPSAQKILLSCPNFYKTVEQKRGPYDATT